MATNHNVLLRRMNVFNTHKLESTQQAAMPQMAMFAHQVFLGLANTLPLIELYSAVLVYCAKFPAIKTASYSPFFLCKNS